MTYQRFYYSIIMYIYSLQQFRRDNMLNPVKKIAALIMALVFTLGLVSVGASAAEKLPLFTVDDFTSRQGEEIAVNVVFAQSVSKKSNQINALDLSLKYDKDVFEVLSISKGTGLIAALNLLKDGDLGVDTGGYIYSENAKTPGTVIWSLSTVEGFTFTKGSVFAVVRIRIKNASNLENSPAFTAEVTSAAKLSDDKKTVIDRTKEFAPYTNKATIAINLATLCDWEYNEETQSYALVKFKDTKATYFTVPDVFDDGVHGEHPVTVIKKSAFRYNTKLETVTLGANIENIETAAFTGCQNLKLVAVYSPTAEIGINAFYGSSDNFVIKCVKDSPADEYAQLNNISVDYFGDLNKCTIEGIEQQKYYDGSPLTMNLLAITGEDGTPLTEGIDYIVEYKDNIEIGKGTVTIKGTGNYFGRLEYKFDILCPYHTDDGNEYFSRTEPTYEDCELGGKAVEHCSKCGYTNEIEYPPKAHAEGVWKELSDPTCTQEGLRALVCPDCGKHIEEENIEKIAHDYVLVHENEPTCQQPGTDMIVCSVCGDLKETIEAPVVDHNKEWITVKEATCTEDGKKEYQCTFCGEVYDTEIIPGGDGHKAAEEWVINDPTCTVDGEKTLACSVCGEILQREPIPASGHVPSELVTKDPTCAEDGYKMIYCTVCNDILSSETIQAPGHTPAEDWTVIATATCTTNGLEALLCTVCGEKTQIRESGALGHDPSEEWTTVHEATCTEDGIQARLCSRCSARIEEKDIKAHGHTSAGVETTKEPDCIHSGTKADKCSECGRYFNEEAIEPLGHDFGEWETVIAANCTEEGFDQRVCTRCRQASQTRDTGPLGHLEVYEYVVAPSYKYEGTERAYCARCNMDLGKTRAVARVYPDVDGDGRISAGDALLILQHSTEIKLLTPEQQKRADCSGDGRINSLDAMIVLQISTGIIVF